jgi:hypothetical protein
MASRVAVTGTALAMAVACRQAAGLAVASGAVPWLPFVTLSFSAPVAASAGGAHEEALSEGFSRPDLGAAPALARASENGAWVGSFDG